MTTTTKPGTHVRDARGWQAVLDDLSHRRTKALAEAARLQRERGPLFLAASGGDEVAEAALSRTVELEEAARREAVNLEEASKQASVELARARASEAHTVRMQRIRQAHALVEARLKAAKAIDAAFLALSGAFHDYTVAARALEAFGDLHGVTSSRMAQFYPVGNAFAHVDATLFRGLEGRPVGSQALVEYEMSLWKDLLTLAEECPT